MSGVAHYRTRSTAESDSEEEFSSSDSSSSSSEEEAEAEVEEEQPRPQQILTPLRFQQQPQLTPAATPDGLSETEKVQLVTDIVEVGGIDSIGRSKYPLERLLSVKADHYPLHLEGKKRSIQNKVNDWKARGKGREEYNRLLRSSAPTPSARSTPTSKRRSTPNSSTRKSKKKATQKPSPLHDPPPIQRTAYASPNPPEEPSFQRPRQEYTRPFVPVPSKLPMSAQRTHLNGARLVNVDDKHPEKNGPLKCFTFQNYQGGDMVLRNGFMLEMQFVDRRWMEMETEAFEAWQVAPNELLLKEPSTSYPYLHAPEEEKKGKVTAKLNDVVFEQATNVPRNAIAADESRQFEYTRFVFPTNLDNSVFSSESENGKITPHIVPLMQSMTYSGPDVNGDQVEVEFDVCVAVNLIFKIAVFEKDKRKMTQKGKKNLLLEQMQKLSVSPSVSMRSAAAPVPPATTSAPVPPATTSAPVPPATTSGSLPASSSLTNQAALEQDAREQAARKQAAQQAAREQAAREQAAREQAARKQAAREQVAREQAARKQAAREQAARERAGVNKPFSTKQNQAAAQPAAAFSIEAWREQEQAVDFNTDQQQQQQGQGQGQDGWNESEVKATFEETDNLDV